VLVIGGGPAGSSVAALKNKLIKITRKQKKQKENKKKQEK
jgi:hypothetical protein